MATINIFRCPHCNGSLYPYYDNEDDKIIPMYKCKNCGKVIYQWP